MEILFSAKPDCLPCCVDCESQTKIFNVTTTAMRLTGTMWSDSFEEDCFKYKTPKATANSGGLDDYGYLGGILIKNNRECDSRGKNGRITYINNPTDVPVIIDQQNSKIGVIYDIYSSDSCGPPTELRDVSITFYFD